MKWRSALLLAAIAALGAAVRLAALEAAEPLRPVGDENYYVRVASHLARGEGHVYVGGMEGESRAWRPPAHAWLLSQLVDPGDPAALDPTGSPSLLLRLARLEVALGVALVVLTGLLGRALFDTRTGLLAALVAALYPALVAHSHYLWSETFFGVLMALALLGVVEGARGRDFALPVLTGLVLGAAALTREVALPVAAVGALWWVGEAPRALRRRALLRGVLLVGAACLALAPWTVRNASLLGRFIPVSTVGWFALAEGNSLESPRWLARSGPAQARFHADYFSKRDELARLEFARAHALERIGAEQPGWLVKKLVRNGALLLNPDSVLRTKIRRGAYGDEPAAAARWLLAASIPAWLALATFGVLGIASSGEGGRRRLACSVFAVVVVLHVLANATPRFRVPWIPLLAVYASHALLGLRTLSSRISARGWLGVGATLFFLYAVCVPYFYLLGGRP